MAKGYVVTSAYFIGKVPLEVLKDIAKVTNTILIGAQVDVVLANRTVARTRFSEIAKHAARSYLTLIQRRSSWKKWRLQNEAGMCMLSKLSASRLFG